VKDSQILSATAHRPWPLPRGPWIMRQTWRELLFAHWPVAPGAIRPRLPAGLTLDTYEGLAWIGVVPFKMTDVRVRGLPPVPTAGEFGELNVRTYVTAQGMPGVLFFSLDAGSALAVIAARTAFFLPYYTARFSIQERGESVRYDCRRLRSASGPIEFIGEYGPSGPVSEARPGSLEDWLTARYCLYTTGRAGRLYRGEIHHMPWPLHPAQAEIARNTMASGQGLALSATPPLLHYSHRLDMVCWPIRAVR
jgi:uncharacterized protein YqjF (DUF2071 family)